MLCNPHPTPTPSAGGATPLAAVSEEQREKAKRVCYAILYGTTAWGLAQGPAALGISVSAAQVCERAVFSGCLWLEICGLWLLLSRPARALRKWCREV